MAMQSVKVPPRSMAISMPAFRGVGGGDTAEGMMKTRVIWKEEYGQYRVCLWKMLIYKEKATEGKVRGGGRCPNQYY